jgi:hypothetical protein
MLRAGRMANGSSARWYSLPTLVADTLSYIPYSPPPSGAIIDFGRTADLAAAIERNRQRLRSIAVAWTERAPGDPASHEMLASVLEAGGELEGPGRSALGAIVQARSSLRGDPSESSDVFLQHLLLGDIQVRILLRSARYRDAGLLADSVLRIRGPRVLDEATKRQTVDVHWRLSALRGRVERVIDLELQYVADVKAYTDEGPQDLPPVIATDVVALSKYAAFGGHADSIRVIGTRISQRLRGVVPARKVTAFRKALLTRPYVLAAPTVGPDMLLDLGPTKDPMAAALMALAAGDRRGARRLLDSIQTIHADRPAGEITMDAVYLRAWLTAQLSDTVTAAQLLDDAFIGLSKAPPSMLGDPTLIAAFIRSINLRADLAQRSGDEATAKSWRAATEALWGSAR